MSTHGISHLALGTAFSVVSLVACNGVTGLGDLEFNRDATGTGGSTSSAGGSTSSAGGTGGEGGTVNGPDPDLVWGQRFGNEGEDYPTALTYTSTGDLLLGGSFSGLLDLGGMTAETTGFQNDAFIARLSPAGAPLYIHSIDDGSLQDCLRDMDLLPSDRVIALVGSGTSLNSCVAANYPMQPSMAGGYFSYGLTAFKLVTLDAAGAQTDEKVLCGTCEEGGAEGPMAVATDLQGNVFVGGSFSGIYLINPNSGVQSQGGVDAFVMRYNSNGNPAWIRNFGIQDGYSVVTDVVSDGMGGVVIAGVFEDRFRIDGATHDIPFSQRPIFVARLDDDDGDVLWSHVFERGWGGSTPHLSAASDGVLMTGDFFGTVDFGGGALQATGQTPATSDAYLVKFGIDGAHVWSRRYGDGDDQRLQQGGTSLVVEPSGNLLLGGAFGGTLDLDGASLTALGARDAFIARLDPAGAYLTHRHIPSASDTTSQGDILVVPSTTGRVAVTGAFIGAVDYGGEQPFESESPSSPVNDGFVVVYEEPFREQH
ncbi:hypothetical protein [Chondromyces apiculatus]|uniref:Beta-propeller repeat protein n=1 Tax=Chondromyces apiculatus DSM 436 TaxID=1192034 RepID=A0A017TFB9_9BACT|nr:hypothetical protein [Chondromyces apiculatus]EYF07510.1 Hypothetical protein CAP_0263 [Chondromyces apiculatus DSM 436]